MIISKPTDYGLDGKPHQGLLMYDDAQATLGPTVLAFHAWDGRSEAHDMFAHRLAALGWTAFSVDLYGKGVVGNTSGGRGATRGERDEDGGHRLLLRRALRVRSGPRRCTT